MTVFTRSLLAATACSAIAVQASAALTVVSDANMLISSNAGATNYDVVPFPPSNNANIYWDANTNGVFGEGAFGENDNNNAGDLAFSAAVTSGVALHFGMEGFTTANETGTMTFTVQLSDASTTTLTVNEGTTLAFNDSNGDMWEADFDFDFGAYGDVVFNGGAGGNGTFFPDHQGILTLTQVPEPGSLALLGLGGLAMLRRRRPITC